MTLSFMSHSLKQALGASFMLGYLCDNKGFVLAYPPSGTTGFALFAPGGKSGIMMNYRICAFCTRGQSGKTVNYGICTFCARGQKWQNGDL